MDSLENPVDNVLTATPELPPPPKRIKIVRDGILGFIVAIALTLGLIIAIVIAGMISGSVSLNSPSFAPTPGLMLAMLFAAEIPFASVAAFLRWRYRSTGRLLPSLFEGSFLSSILIGVAAGVAMATFGYAHAFVATLLFGKASTEAMEDLMRTLFSVKNDPVMAAGMVFAIAVLAPLCEEFFFRGAIFSSVRSTQSARAAAIVSSFLFAIAHGNWMMFTYYLVFGLTMCWLLSKTQTIATPIAAHMTVNATAAIAMLMSHTPQ